MLNERKTKRTSALFDRLCARLLQAGGRGALSESGAQRLRAEHVHVLVLDPTARIHMIHASAWVSQACTLHHLLPVLDNSERHVWPPMPTAKETNVRLYSHWRWFFILAL